MTPDVKWMRRAIRLARLSEGATRPNPPVGAVLVKDGVLISEGRHHVAGGPHAEINAFDHCHTSARGATLYVTLEPCCTHGRTGPCTERIISEGVARVVVACTDRHACHAGRGLDVLRAAGIVVTDGVCTNEALPLVEPFFKHVQTGMPWVTLKLAMTLDGRIADRTGASRWITGEAARAIVQDFRRRADAVMVGAGTVCADDPSLLCHARGGNPNLMRVILDGSGRVPDTARVLTDEAAARTWMIRKRMALSTVLQKLGERGVMHVLCEGGATLASALHDAGLVDEYVLMLAPKIMGDAHALSAFMGHGTLMRGLHALNICECRMVGDDILVRARPMSRENT